MIDYKLMLLAKPYNIYTSSFHRSPSLFVISRWPQLTLYSCDHPW